VRARRLLRIAGMRRALAITALVAASLAVTPSVARASGADVVQVEGRTFRGTVVESRPRVLVRIRLDDGSVLTVPWSEVVSMQIGSGSVGLPPTPTPPRAPCESQPKQWYGWQTLLVGAGSVILMALPSAVGVFTYALGPPIVHTAHGRWATGLGSFGLRVGLPFLLGLSGLMIGALSPSASNNPGAIIEGGILGLAGGMVAASAIDAAWLAWEPVRASDGATSGRLPPLTVIPMIALPVGSEHGYARGLGIAGTF
jgi:hypothetical protein